MMTLRELGELVIWFGAVAAAIAAIGVVLRFAVVRPLRRWIAEQVARPLQDTAKHLETSNGTTAGAYIEASAGTLVELRDELRATNTLAIATQAVALENSRRIDEHLIKHHGGTDE